MSISDAHVHFFSHRFYAALAKGKKVDGPAALEPLLGWELPAPDPHELAKRWIAEFDANGVRRGCLIASVPGDEESVSTAVALYPERFFGYFMFDPLQPDSLQRVQAAAANRHLHCICLFPAMHKYPVADARLIPLLEAAAAARLAVFVHCGSISVGVRNKLGLQTDFDMRFSNPLDLHSIALRFPQIRFVVPHFGAGMFREALMLADLCPNVWLDTSSSNRWMMYEGLNLRSVFRRCVDVIGPKRLLFGTDSSFFPRGWHRAIFEQQQAALKELGLAAAEVQAILELNLEEFHQPRLSLGG